MEYIWRALFLASVLCLGRVKSQGQGQECSSFTDITQSIMEVLVNTTGTPCVRCLDGDGQAPANTAYITGGDFIMDGSVPGLAVSNGVLMILDPARLIPDGTDSLTLDCQSETAFRYTDFELFSNNLVPPTASPPSLTINENCTQSVICSSANSGLLGVGAFWIDPRMMVAEEGQFNNLRFENIQRSQSGEYVCILTSNVTGKTASITVPVVVQYAPEATTTEVMAREINLEGDLMLTCDFDGVPTPSVTWIQNSTIQLNDSDSRINVTSEAGVSTLQIMELGRDAGGLYSCSFQNVVGNLDVMVTTVLILNLIITSSKPLSVLLGDYISLNCSPIVPTGGEISYTWTLLNTSTVLEETSNILTFPRISMEQLGTYRCSVSRSSGAEVTITSARPLIEIGSYPAKITRGSCPNPQSTLEDILVDVLQLLSAQFGLHPLGLSMSFPAESCDQVAEANPDSPSGMYWIYSADGNPAQVLCQYSN